MKKLVIISAALLAVLTSCTDKIVKAPAAKAIDFENPFVDNAVKSTGADVTTANLQKFFVYGFLNSAADAIFSNQMVTGSGTSAVWSYSPVQYWAVNGNYSFTAIAPESSAWTFSPLTTGTAPLEGGSIALVNDGATDLIYSYAEVNNCDPANQAPVAFTFNHLLSRVKFSVVNGYPAADNVLIKVTNVKISNALKDGAYDCQSHTWAATNDAANYFELSFGDIAGGAKVSTADGASDTDSHKYVLALDKTLYPSLSLSFDLEVYQRSTIGGVTNDNLLMSETLNGTVANNFDFQAGFSYNFVAEIGGQGGVDHLHPIEFKLADVQEWEDWEDVAATIQ